MGMLLLSIVLVLGSKAAWASESEFCTTKACNETAKRVLSFIDEEVDPCEDFYLYACGKFPSVVPLGPIFQHIDTFGLMQKELNERSYSLLDNLSLTSHNSKAVRKAKNLYDQCVKNENHFLTEQLKRMNLLHLRQQKQQRKDAMTLLPEKTYDDMRQQGRKLQCFLSVAESYRWVVDRIYLDTFFDKTESRLSRKLINHVHETFVNRLPFSWLTRDTRQNVHDYLMQLKKNIGYSEWILNDKELDREYEGKILTLSEFVTRKAGPVQSAGGHHGWIIPRILEVDASSDDEGIWIPAGLLHGYIFNASVPSALNYGAAGFMAAHEISHGVHKCIRRGDRQSRVALSVSEECIENQLIQLVEPQTGMKPNPKYLSGGPGEIVADVAAVNASFFAYQDVKEGDKMPLQLSQKFTKEQIFFLSTANLWCHHSTDQYIRKILNSSDNAPRHAFNYYRVMVPLLNNAMFSRAFQCKKGSRMNPVHKCQLW